MIYFAIVGAGCIALLLFAWSAYRRACVDAYRYRLFAVRDELTFLAAQGKVSENDLIYEVTCDLVHATINGIEHFKLRRFARALVDSAEKAPPDHAAVERFFEAMKEADPEVRHVALTYFEAVASILTETSTGLRLWIFVRRSVRGTVSRVLARVVPKPLTVQAYKQSRKMQHELGLLPNGGHPAAVA